MRPSHNFFMRWAIDLANTCSTCAKMKVGCILVKDNRILSFGYNGTMSGDKHCNEHFTGEILLEINKQEFYKQHKIFAEKYEIHAEHNAIFDALNRGQNLSGSTLYCTHSPCLNCCKMILTSGIKEVLYNIEYTETIETVRELLSNSGIELYKHGV